MGEDFQHFLLDLGFNKPLSELENALMIYALSTWKNGVAPSLIVSRRPASQSDFASVLPYRLWARCLQADPFSKAPGSCMVQC